MTGLVWEVLLTCNGRIGEKAVSVFLRNVLPGDLKGLPKAKDLLLVEEVVVRVVTEPVGGLRFRLGLRMGTGQI